MDMRGRIMIAGGLVIGGLLLLSATPALAGGMPEGGKQGGNPPAFGQKGEMRGGPGMGAGMDQGRPTDQGKSLDKLVDGGIIDQETADDLEAYLADKFTPGQEKAEPSEGEKEKGAPPDFLADAVADGIITQGQADAINEYRQEQRGTQDKERSSEQDKERPPEQEIDRTAALESLVSAGTITEEQADEIENYLQSRQEERETRMEALKNLTEEERKAALESQRASREAEMAQLKDMTEEDRQAYLEQNRPQPLSELVDNGTLTEDEADAVAQALFHRDREAQN